MVQKCSSKSSTLLYIIIYLLLLVVVSYNLIMQWPTPETEVPKT